MAQVMEQGCCIEHAPMDFQCRIHGQQALKGLSSDVEHAQRVGEPTRFSSVEG
jgi:hypothetical protein